VNRSSKRNRPKANSETLDRPIGRAVELGFKKPRFLGFLKNLKKPKKNNLGFLGFFKI